MPMSLCHIIAGEATSSSAGCRQPAWPWLELKLEGNERMSRGHGHGHEHGQSGTRQAVRQHHPATPNPPKTKIPIIVHRPHIRAPYFQPAKTRHNSNSSDAMLQRCRRRNRNRNCGSRRTRKQEPKCTRQNILEEVRFLFFQVSVQDTPKIKFPLIQKTSRISKIF